MRVAGCESTWSSPLPAWHVYWAVSVTAAALMTRELSSSLRWRWDDVWKLTGMPSTRHSTANVSYGSVAASQRRTTSSPTFTVRLAGPSTIRVGTTQRQRQRSFSADRRTVALMLQCCVCLSSIYTEYIVAKRCILEQKLLLTAYRKSYMRNRLVPRWMTLTFV